jgi:hypothetical protein
MCCFRCCKASVINVDDLRDDETLTPGLLITTTALQLMTTNLDRELDCQQRGSRSRYDALQNTTPARCDSYSDCHTMSLASAV